MILAGWPSCTSGMSVSSTSTSASITDMSATVKQHGAGIVHGADHHVFALFDVAAGDDAVEGGLEADLGQRVLAAAEAGLLLIELGLAVLDFLLASLQIALTHFDFGLGAFERLARGQARRRQFLLAFQALPRHVELGACALQPDARLFERGAGAGDGSDVAAYRGFGVDRIDLQQELAGAAPDRLLSRRGG